MGTFATFIRYIWASLRTKDMGLSCAHSGSANATPATHSTIPSGKPNLVVVPVRQTSATAHLNNTTCLVRERTTIHARNADIPSAPFAVNHPPDRKDTLQASRRCTPRLRVVQHIINPSPTGPAQAAMRLTMSGTLADICAELDRLTQLEQSASYLDMKSPRSPSRRSSASLAAA
jgi:hypothetical protein